MPPRRCALAQQPFDLVISDINLGAQQTGLDVLRAFKQGNPNGQVVLISGFGTLETAIDAVRAGAFDYISKPFNITEVKATVERALSDVRAPALARPSCDVPPARPDRPHRRRCCRSTSRSPTPPTPRRRC